MGSDVPTIWGTSERASQEQGDQEEAAVAALHVKPLVATLTASVRRVALIYPAK